jgi:hypothetical protein
MENPSPWLLIRLAQAAVDLYSSLRKRRRSVRFPSSAKSMSQHDIEWNQTKQEWIWKRCQLASDHLSKSDAKCELSQFDCVKAEKQDAD